MKVIDNECEYRLRYDDKILSTLTTTKALIWTRCCMGREEWTEELAEIGTSMGSSFRSISSRNEHEDKNIFC